MIARVRRGTRDPPWPWAPPWRTFRKGRALFDAAPEKSPFTATVARNDAVWAVTRTALSARFPIPADGGVPRGAAVERFGTVPRIPVGNSAPAPHDWRHP